MTHEEKTALVPQADKQVEEDLWEIYGAERGVWTEPMLVALEKGVKGNKWFSLIDKVWSEETLGIAWEKVQSNAGACGVDRISVEFFGKESQNRLLAVKEQLKEGRYEPKPIRRVWIDKLGSKEKRPLGIPAVIDRVVQAAVKMVIEPIFERDFAENSYGFRPGSGCKDALREVERLLRGGYEYVVNIPHEALMKLVRERISDGRVLGLLESFLKQGVMEGGEMWMPEKGSPQGGIVSPLMANLYLNPLNWLLSELGFESVRYADELVILAKSEEEAQRALEEVRR